MSPKLPVITPKELIRALQKTGFRIHNQKGSHITLKHQDYPNRRVIVPFHNRDMKRGTLSGILKDAGLTINTIEKLL